MNRRVHLFVLLAVLCISVLSSAQSPSGQDSPSADVTLQLAAASVPAVGKPLIITVNGSQKTVCPANGNSTKPELQDLDYNKNRTDEPSPSAYVVISWDDLKSLPADSVAKIQGAPVAVVGHLSHKIEVETDKPGESTNCNLLEPNEVDWHMYLTKNKAEPIADAIIVETTPRVRPQHKWTTQMLEPYVNSDKLVRVSGWLLYDVQHVDVVGKERATVWEVHPITRIEVQDAQGNWANIEQ